MKIIIADRGETEEFEAEAFLLALKHNGAESIRYHCSEDEKASLTLLILADYLRQRFQNYQSLS